MKYVTLEQALDYIAIARGEGYETIHLGKRELDLVDRSYDLARHDAVDGVLIPLATWKHILELDCGDDIAEVLLTIETARKESET